MLRRLPLVITALPVLACFGCKPPSAVPPPHAPSTPTRVDARPRPLRLTDVTTAAGIRFRHHTGAFGRKWFPETNGAGVAFIDYDGDGYPDVFLVNGRDWNAAERKRAGLPPASRSPATPSRLYRNLHNGTFRDVTAETGVGVPMYGMGCAVGDYDNDGYPDLYVSGVGRGRLFHNEGGRRFEETSGRVGVGGDGWGSSCAWVDYDRDGRLDLFVGHYVRWDPRTDRPCSGQNDRPVYCGPNVYLPEPSRLYHQNADGTFADVSKRAGLWSRAGRPVVSKAMGVAVCDMDRDGWPDLAIANDTEANTLFRNNHNGTFTELGMERGIALPSGGLARSGMGIDAGDWDGSDGDTLLIGNFIDEMMALYRPDRDGFFTDVAAKTGVAQPSRTFTTFGCLWVDLDGDGRLDIAAANGHIDEKSEQGTPAPLRQRPLFLLNRKGESFREAPLVSERLVGRGLAAGDFDRNGSVDLILTTNGGAPALFRNDGREGQSLRLVLEGTRSNRSAIGAEVEATVGSRVVRRRVKSGSSYLSASELPLTLGLGPAKQVDRLTVRWPNGQSEKVRALVAGSEYRLREGAGIVGSVPLARE